MFLTQSERDSATRGDRQVPGIMIRLGSGTRYFIAGADEPLCMAVARIAHADVLDDPLTRIEMGRAHGAHWICERVVKTPIDPNERPDRP